MVSGASDVSEGLESKADLTINGGNLYVYAYDDAINAAKSITVNGGRIYAYAEDLKDGTTYQVSSNGKVENATEVWNGWHSGGSPVISEEAPRWMPPLFTLLSS